MNRTDAQGVGASQWNARHQHGDNCARVPFWKFIMMGVPAARPYRVVVAALIALLLIVALSGCGAASVMIIPTTRPTLTPTLTVAPSQTPDRDVTPTIPPSPLPRTATGGPSPTPLFGAAATLPGQPTGTARVLDPNAPRIEFFTTDVLAVVPGETVNLYWSTRNTTTAVIYRVERGIRSRLWNVEPDGSLPVQTNARDRGALDFMLSVGDGAARIELPLSVPLACPNLWFFTPPAEACPDAAPQETGLIEQGFERGRLFYVVATDTLYALFNDGTTPAWVAFPNRYDPAIHPEFEPNFNPPPGFYQPVRVLGFLWRGNDTVRGRLGLAIQPELTVNGFVQVATNVGGASTLYASSADGTVLGLLPEGTAWEIVTPL